MEADMIASEMTIITEEEEEMSIIGVTKDVIEMEEDMEGTGNVVIVEVVAAVEAEVLADPLAVEVLVIVPPLVIAVVEVVAEVAATVEVPVWIIGIIGLQEKTIVDHHPTKINPKKTVHPKKNAKIKGDEVEADPEAMTKNMETTRIVNEKKWT